MDGQLVVAIIALVVAAMSVIFSWKQAGSAAKSAEAAKTSARAAEESNRHAAESNEIAREANARATERHDAGWDGRWVGERGGLAVVNKGADVAHKVRIAVTQDDETCSGNFERVEGGQGEVVEMARTVLQIAQYLREAKAHELAKQYVVPTAYIPSRFDFHVRVYWETDAGVQREREFPVTEWF